MAVILSICSGWTGRLGPFTLRIDGTPFNLSGLTVVPVVRRGDNSIVTTTGTVTVDPNQGGNTGQLSFDPGTNDFLLDPTSPTLQIFHLHWKVTDGGGKVVFFPNDEADQVRVYQA